MAKSKKQIKAKKSKFVKTIDKVFIMDFFISKAKTTFLYLQTAFIEVPIFYYFNTKSYIQIKTDALKYTINEVFSQLTLDQQSSNHMTWKN